MCLRFVNELKKERSKRNHPGEQTLAAHPTLHDSGLWGSGAHRNVRIGCLGGLCKIVEGLWVL